MRADWQSPVPDSSAAAKLDPHAVVCIPLHVVKTAPQRGPCSSRGCPTWWPSMPAPASIMCTLPSHMHVSLTQHSIHACLLLHAGCGLGYTIKHACTRQDIHECAS